MMANISAGLKSCGKVFTSLEATVEPKSEKLTHGLCASGFSIFQETEDELIPGFDPYPAKF